VEPVILAETALHIGSQSRRDDTYLVSPATDRTPYPLTDTELLPETQKSRRDDRCITTGRTGGLKRDSLPRSSQSRRDDTYLVSPATDRTPYPLTDTELLPETQKSRRDDRCITAGVTGGEGGRWNR